MLIRMFVVPSMQVSSVCTVERGLDSLLGAGRIRAPERSTCPLEPSIASERLWQRTSKMTAPPELRALSPPHPSEDRLRRRRPPRRLQLSWDWDGLPEGGRDTVHKCLEDRCQVDFLALAVHIMQ